jgi:hypothetical protein
MTKDTNLQSENNTQYDLSRTDPDKQRKGYNEQNPTQPHGSFKRDADSTKKRSKEKGF